MKVVRCRRRLLVLLLLLCLNLQRVGSQSSDGCRRCRGICGKQTAQTTSLVPPTHSHSGMGLQHQHQQHQWQQSWLKGLCK